MKNEKQNNVSSLYTSSSGAATSRFRSRSFCSSTCHTTTVSILSTSPYMNNLFYTDNIQLVFLFHQPNISFFKISTSGIFPEAGW